MQKAKVAFARNDSESAGRRRLRVAAFVRLGIESFGTGEPNPVR